jgi:glyoxylase-like metal-dependent hydrolase (beta-lactamase superfamily II)/rhodanese-related sulfurtransferase
MLFRQIIQDDLGCASYLIGDHRAGVAAVVDPRFEIDEYLEVARFFGVTIEHVLETHNHADHVSGHGRLAATTGASIHVHATANVDYPNEPFEDGWELELGSLRVRAIHTPGHRPEHTAFALIDSNRGDEPWAVLSGDTLFVGDVARPDLAVDKEEGASDIFRSLHEKLFTLPPETEVWPGHLGGSLCGGPGMDLKVSSTIGYEMRHNALFAETDEERFVERATAKLPPQPPNFQAVVDLNRGPLLTAGVELMPLAPRQLENKRAEGSLLVDVRTDLQFSEAHIPGSVAITMLSSGFGTKLAWVADPGQEIVLIGRDDEDARRAGRLAVAIGVRNLGGFLTGGMTSWRAEQRDVGHMERISIEELVRRHEEDPQLQILDVREKHERETGWIPGSIHVPYHAVRDVPDGIDGKAPVAVICSSGKRSVVAASQLKRFGLENVIHVADGGVGTWRDLGQPLEGG